MAFRANQFVIWSRDHRLYSSGTRRFTVAIRTPTGRVITAGGDGYRACMRFTGALPHSSKLPRLHYRPRILLQLRLKPNKRYREGRCPRQCAAPTSRVSSDQRRAVTVASSLKSIPGPVSAARTCWAGWMRQPRRVPVLAS